MKIQGQDTFLKSEPCIGNKEKDNGQNPRNSPYVHEVRVLSHKIKIYRLYKYMYNKVIKSKINGSWTFL